VSVVEFLREKKNWLELDLVNIVTITVMPHPLLSGCQSAGERHKRSVQGVRPHVSNASQD
jgi:hypothetical protein